MENKAKKLKNVLGLCLSVMFLVALVSPIGYARTKAASKVRLNKTEITLYVNETCKLKVKGTKATAEWSSTDKTVATVSSKGRVKAKKGGCAIISALVDGVTYSCSVTVKCRQHNYEIVEVTKKAKKEKPGLGVCICRDCGETDENCTIYYQPTEAKAYKDIIAMKEEHPDGTAWSNDDFYFWEVDHCSGYGCAGFAFMMSDVAFGTKTPVTWHNDLNKLKVGDIIRINHDTHSVVVLSIKGDTITICEGNYSRKVRWGRTLSKKKLESDEDLYIYTRYLDY